MSDYNKEFKVLRVKKLDSAAHIPVRSESGAAGLDLYSSTDVFIPTGATAVVSTGIAMAIPTNFYGKIEDRSSMAAKGLRTGAGVIDSSYRGEVKVVIHNFSSSEASDPVLMRKGYQIKKGDRIAQLIIQEYDRPIIETVEFLDDTSRGSGGFGSTGR